MRAGKRTYRPVRGDFERAAIRTGRVYSIHGLWPTRNPLAGQGETVSQRLVRVTGGTKNEPVYEMHTPHNGAQNAADLSRLASGMLGTLRGPREREPRKGKLPVPVRGKRVAGVRWRWDDTVGDMVPYYTAHVRATTTRRTESASPIITGEAGRSEFERLNREADEHHKLAIARRRAGALAGEIGFGDK